MVRSITLKKVKRMINCIDKVFVTHWAPLTERRDTLAPILTNYHQNVEWVTEYDRNNLEGKSLELFVENEEYWVERQGQMYKGLSPYRKISMGEICNMLNHIECLKRIVDQKIEISLILEDDVIPFSNLYPKFDEVYNEMPNDWDMAFIGQNYNVTAFNNNHTSPPIHPVEGRNVYEKLPPQTRTVDAYMVKLETAKQLLDIIDNVVLPWDFELAHWLKELNMKVYHWWPGLTGQGTFMGQYQTRGGLEN